MNIEILNNYKKFFRSDYNEGTEDELSYYIDIQKHKIGDTGYLYLHQDKSITKMSIVHIITNKTIPINMYDRLIENDDVLINGEEKYNADTSAEFITDDECMLIWFRVVDDKPPISCDVLKDRIRAIASEYRQLREPLDDSEREFKKQLYIAYQLLMKEYHKYFIDKKDKDN